jgi:alkane 1-monooxygenase
VSDCGGQESVKMQVAINPGSNRPDVTVRADEPRISITRAWMLHLWAYVLPVCNALFLFTGPHNVWQAALWVVPLLTLVLVDNRAPDDLRQPDDKAPHWLFDLHVYALTALQLMNHIMVGVMASKLLIWPWTEWPTTLANLIAIAILSGVSAGYTGIVLGHELVHRRNKAEYFLGRLLLMFVCYEHFATEHIRGHHPRVGLREDPATARFGEDFQRFLRRTVPAQFKSAWHLEKVRLGDADMKNTDRRMLRHRVLQGVVAEVLITVGYLVFFGIPGVIAFLLQSRTAILMLEAVNYVEHWGLVRVGKTVRVIDSWDTDNWFTLHTLVGLSRHSDHHNRASRSYHLLRHFDASPKMPRGYYGTVLMALTRNEEYQALATAELKRKRLGPFVEDQDLAPSGELVAAQ